MSKAFDRLNHDILFIKLMDRNVPMDLIKLLISVGDKLISWQNEIKYLGVNIMCSKSFKLNLQRTKQKCFRALNAIL